MEPPFQLRETDNKKLNKLDGILIAVNMMEKNETGEEIAHGQRAIVGR